MIFPAQNAIGITPSIGLLFQSEKIENLNIRTEISYANIFYKTNYNLINIGVGVSYYFY